jgi:PAS domain S-box-containing protein
VRNLDKTLYANNGYARLLGYTNVAELIAVPPVEVADEGIHPEDREEAAARIRACLEGREPISQYEYRMKRRDGSHIWLEATAALVQWDDAPALLSWVLDISARKRVEAELVESREAAERASKAKSTFLASMSHELRTPLNAILGFSEMISTQLYGPLHAKYAEYATDIHRSGEHLLALINDILDMSKLEAGKLTLNESNVGVAALVQDCLLLVRHRAQQAGLTIIELVADDIPLVWADERALKQVILNFLSNAVKFTPRGGIVTIGAAFVAGIGIEIFVADTGIGMSEDGVRVATEPFGQIDSKITRENKGTGLGLPISIGLMQRHGGDISIASAPNKGTRLTARLPIGRVISAAA